MFYRIENDFENCFSLLIENTELGEKMPHYSPKYRAKSKLGGWVAPKASYFKSENYSNVEDVLPDISLWYFGVLALSPQAYDKLADDMSSGGEFLPITVEGVTHYLFNPLYVAKESALDLSSATDLVDSGVHIGKQGFSFRESELEGVQVFKTNEDKLVHSYCTEQFKQRLEANGYRGLKFKKEF